MQHDTHPDLASLDDWEGHRALQAVRSPRVTFTGFRSLKACQCGATTTRAEVVNTRCADCCTFPADHPYRDAGFDADGEPYLRCADCDTRPWSHGLTPRGER
jgi:hypothetical protein